MIYMYEFLKFEHQIPDSETRADLVHKISDLFYKIKGSRNDDILCEDNIL